MNTAFLCRVRAITIVEVLHMRRDGADDLEETLRQLAALADRQDLVRRAQEGCARWLHQHPNRYPFAAGEVQLSLQTQTLCFRNTLLNYPYIDTRLEIRVGEQEVGYYRLITLLDGTVDDDYFVLEESSYDASTANNHDRHDVARTFKFRAWDTVDQVWLQEWSIDAGVPRACTRNRLEDVVLMQSTGMTDTRGREIYEGDIVDIGEPILAAVAWFHDGWILEHGEMTKGPVSAWLERLEVIGNRYEQPDLVPPPDR